MKEKGQALIELIIFLPLIFMLYSVISGYANAINGSINQQKITRAYFFNITQNNSYILNDFQPGWRKAGMFFIGWADALENNAIPIQPCYKVSIPIAPGTDDVCEEQYTTTSTQFIRVGTVFGICGATYARSTGGSSGNEIAPTLMPDGLGANFSQALDYSSCLIE